MKTRPCMLRGTVIAAEITNRRETAHDLKIIFRGDDGSTFEDRFCLVSPAVNDTARLREMLLFSGHPRPDYLEDSSELLGLSVMAWVHENGIAHEYAPTTENPVEPGDADENLTDSVTYVESSLACPVCLGGVYSSGPAFVRRSDAAVIIRCVCSANHHSEISIYTSASGLVQAAYQRFPWAAGSSKND